VGHGEERIFGERLVVCDSPRDVGQRQGSDAGVPSGCILVPLPVSIAVGRLSAICQPIATFPESAGALYDPPLRHYSEASQVFSGRDGAAMVAPASSKEAVTHHVVAKQKKEGYQDDDKQELSNPQPGGPSFLRPRCIQISCHQSRLRTSLISPDNEIDPSNLRPVPHSHAARGRLGGT
jgi:hypothetical protein